MSATPVICFGQQPCGFFPRRFLFAKFQTARRIQSETGGEIVFFYHDSDHDPRETRTTLRHRKTGEPIELNFAFDNPIQRKFSPLYRKRVRPDWHAKTLLQLPAFVDRRWVEAFGGTTAANVADFCLEMYRRMGLLEGIRVVRSGDREFRRRACDVADFFVDVPYEGETVRARWMDGALKLHKGGNTFVTLPPMDFGKEQISPSRDSRLRWMQSVVRCTHYVAGASEQAYLRREDTPEITFMNRDSIDRSDEAYTELSTESTPMLVFGAHPDDIEFGAGAVVAQEVRLGRLVHLVVCSRGESGSRGTPAERVREAKNAAALLGATIEFIHLDGDAHVEIRSGHAIRLAGVIRRLRPEIVLAPSVVQNQHPDHWRLGTLVRDASRLARYGGIAGLRKQPVHAIAQLLFYAVTPEAEPSDISPLLIDVSAPETVAIWTAAMEAHVTQVTARRYVEHQLTRARMLGFRAGVAHAMALFPNDPPLFKSLRPLGGSANRL